MEKQIRIGVSSCLLGNAVRYDGGHKHVPFITEALGRRCEFLPVCPEVEAGLPVPREAMQLVGNAGSPRLITIETRIDRTEQVLCRAEEVLERIERQNICGYIFKARSPSCALDDSTLCTPFGETSGKTPGLFARAVMRRLPLLPVIDEEGLADSSARDGFLELVRAYCRCSGPRW